MAALGVAACLAGGVSGGATGCAKRPAHKRTGDAAAVERVTTPALPDGGVPGGPATEEVEPNDTNDTATALVLGGTVHGKIDPEADVDRYRIEVTQAGALSVMASALDAVDLVLELEDAGGTVVARSDRGGARVREGIPNFGVTPGRYFAVVRGKKLPAAAPARPKKSARKSGSAGSAAALPPAEPARPAGGPYELTASMIAPAAGAEHEPDDDRGQANDLIAGDIGTGFLGWTGDADAWKVSIEALSAKNALDLELTPVEGVALQLEIADGVGKPIVKRTGRKGGPLVVRGFVPAVPPGAPPFLYLIVKAAERSNPETVYQIRAIAKVVPPDAEIEPNDTPDTAMAMPADRKSLHAQWSTGDVDCFSVAAQDAAHTLEAAIDTPNELDLAIEILVDGTIVARSDHPGKGAAEKAVAAIPAGKLAVIRVRGTESSDEAGYELSVTDGASP
ncbi:MAG TPA: hypothetical protein VH165_24855 [Kofleriaceae bacterium]|nr:hypothetical protein [Kofleriaceae bacterium]